MFPPKVLARAACVLALTAVAASSSAQPPAGAATAAAAQAAAAERQRQQDATPDTPGTGRYAAMKELDPGLPDHVIYRPGNLAALGTTKLGVYAFGNGGCTDDGASARLHLLEIASHGYLAIAPGRIYNGPGKTRAAGSPARHKPRGCTRRDARSATTRGHRLGAEGEHAEGQPVLRTHRSARHRDLGLQLRRNPSAAERQGSACRRRL